MQFFFLSFFPHCGFNPKRNWQEKAVCYLGKVYLLLITAREKLAEPPAVPLLSSVSGL